MNIKHFVALAVIALLSGCASTPTHDYASSFEGDPTTVIRLFDGWTGETAAWDDLVERASKSDVILIGESHGHALGLAAASKLWIDVLERTDSAALCLEFFERDQQIALDDFMAEIIDEQEFRRLARRTSGNYPAGHSDMVEAAREHDRPVIAANAPRRYVSHVRHEGYDSLAELNAAQKSLFVVPEEMPSGDYKDEFFEMMGGMATSHATGDDSEEMSEEESQEMIEGMFRSQAMWDATMSNTVARAISSGNAPVVLVIGRFHVDNEGGTVQLLRKAAPDASILVISVDGSADNELAEDDQGRADFVIYAGGV